MNGLTLRADYGPYIVTAISPTQHFYTDTGLSAAVTLPAVITGTTTWYCAPAYSDFYTFTCKQRDGSDISPGVPQWVGTTADSTLNPRPSLAQISADVSDSYLDQNAPLSYRELIPRALCTATNVTVPSGYMRWSSFIAPETESIASVSACVAGTAAGATPTLVRFGIFTVASDGALTLVASTTNDTALLGSTNAVSTKALTTPYTLTAGLRYAVGLVVVTGATAPQVLGATTNQALLNLSPRLGGAISGQSDLPETVAAANLNAASSGSVVWFGLTPA